MGIYLNWEDDAQSILWMEVVGKWTWYDFARANHDTALKMRDMGHRVDVIVDMRQAASAPTQNDNQTLRDAVEQMPANHGLTVFIGADRFTEMTIKIMQGFIPRLKSRIHIAATVDAAADIVFSQRDPSASSATT